MTVKELYDWAIKNSLEDFPISIYQPECYDIPAEYIEITEVSDDGTYVILYPW